MCTSQREDDATSAASTASRKSPQQVPAVRMRPSMDPWCAGHGADRCRTPLAFDSRDSFDRSRAQCAALLENRCSQRYAGLSRPGQALLGRSMARVAVISARNAARQCACQVHAPSAATPAWHSRPHRCDASTGPPSATMRCTTSFRDTRLTVAQWRRASMNCTKLAASCDCGFTSWKTLSASPEVRSLSDSSRASLHTRRPQRTSSAKRQFAEQ